MPVLMTMLQWEQAKRRRPSGTEPNAILRGAQSATRLADKRPLDGDMSEDEDESSSSSDDDSTTSSGDESTSSDESSTPSTNVDVEPEERAGLMSHAALKALAASVRAGRVGAPQRLERPLTQREHDANFDALGTVREISPYPGENFSHYSAADSIARGLGLDTVDELFAARDYAKRRAQSTQEHAVTQRMKNERTPEDRRVLDALGLAAKPTKDGVARLKAAALAKQFGGGR